MTENRIFVLLMINLILLLIGMIVDDVSGSVLAAIVLLPVATEIGVHPIHFAAIVGTNLGLGNVSPPCAPMLYMAAGISKLTLDKYVVPTMKLLALPTSRWRATTSITSSGVFRPGNAAYTVSPSALANINATSSFLATSNSSHLPSLIVA